MRKTLVWGVRKVKYIGPRIYENMIAAFVTEKSALDYADMAEPFLANDEEIWVDAFDSFESSLCRHSFKFKDNGGE